MILSYHPCFVADENLICAGRPPDENDLQAIKAADAVILSQGCSRALFNMARQNCAHVFPDFTAKFDYPGKTGQIRLFQKTGVAHPAAFIYADCTTFKKYCGASAARLPFGYPFVFKFDWGGEGDAVFRVDDANAFASLLDKAAAQEQSGYRGFLVQEYIPCHQRTLRVVVVGTRFISYWRIQNNTASFGSGLKHGGAVDHHHAPQLQTAAVKCTRNFCRKTNINLAGFDFLFSSVANFNQPLFLEINYFFGRKGLGGSQAFYELLQKEILNWLKRLDLSLKGH
jgi:ribosomal protein S6--L-glutamate ligase